MNTKTLSSKVVIAGLLLLLPSLSFAQGDELSGANTAWILTATALVLFMTLPGLSLFYGGLVRTKNVLSILMQCFAVTVIVSLLWLAVGYSIAFGPSESAFWGGLSKAFLSGVVVDSMSGDIPENSSLSFWLITPCCKIAVGCSSFSISYSALASLLASARSS